MCVIGIRVPFKVVGVVTKAAVELSLLRVDSELKREADVLDSYVLENVIANRGSELDHILEALTDG